MSKVIALYHIVFCTKYRQMTVRHDSCEDVYRFIWRIITDNKCKLVRIGGAPNHIHMLIDLHPSVALADLMRLIKTNSSNWLRADDRFPGFQGWAPEYFASTISPADKPGVVAYIKSQVEHHQVAALDEELRYMHRMADLDYDEKDMK